jgi:phosphoribosylaminoimidazole-succinocarboxamide synthase
VAFGFSFFKFKDASLPRKRPVYEGSRKSLFEGPEPGTYILQFRDDLTLRGQPTSTVTIPRRGAINNRISEILMGRLSDINIQTHFIRRHNMREQVVRSVEALPFFVRIYNVANQELSERLGVENSFRFTEPLFEFRISSPAHKESMVSSQHISALGWSDPDEIERIFITTQRINDFLCGHFSALGFQLLQCRLKFGRLHTDFFTEPQLVVIDEISPDTCCLRDYETDEIFYALTGGVSPVREDYDPSQVYNLLAKRFRLLSQDLSE